MALMSYQEIPLFKAAHGPDILSKIQSLKLPASHQTIRSVAANQPKKCPDVSVKNSSGKSTDSKTPSEI